MTIAITTIENDSGVATPTNRDFVYTTHAQRVVFGAGSVLRLAEELALLGVKRPMLLCTPHLRKTAESMADSLGTPVAGIFDGALMHVPLHSVHAARDATRATGADGLVALGGGSTTGLGKAITLEIALPLLAIPTTYAGSEMTPIYGITEGGLKKTGKDWRVRPCTVLYDPELTLDLPLQLSVVSAFNAIAHAAEGLYSLEANPVTSLMAEEGISALARALPALRETLRHRAARSEALYGAWLCGSVLGQVGMALHHKLCHTLGGSFNLPHAETHTVVLPHALAYNASSAPEAMRRIAKALGGDDAPSAVYLLARRHGAPASLRELGMEERDLDHAARVAAEHPYWNPRPIEQSGLRRLLQAAFDGAPPISN